MKARTRIMTTVALVSISLLGGVLGYSLGGLDGFISTALFVYTLISIVLIGFNKVKFDR